MKNTQNEWHRAPRMALTLEQGGTQARCQPRCKYCPGKTLSGVGTEQFLRSFPSQAKPFETQGRLPASGVLIARLWGPHRCPLPVPRGQLRTHRGCSPGRDPSPPARRQRGQGAELALHVPHHILTSRGPKPQMLIPNQLQQGPHHPGSGLWFAFPRPPPPANGSKGCLRQLGTDGQKHRLFVVIFWPRCCSKCLLLRFCLQLSATVSKLHLSRVLQRGCPRV